MDWNWEEVIRDDKRHLISKVEVKNTYFLERPDGYVAKGTRVRIHLYRRDLKKWCALAHELGLPDHSQIMHDDDRGRTYIEFSCPGHIFYPPEYKHLEKQQCPCRKRNNG